MRDLNHGPRFAADDLNHTIDAADLGLPLRLARFKELFNARQTGGDVNAGDTAGVEGSHRELCTWLTDRLRRHDADRFTKRNQLARGEVAPVAGLADAGWCDAAEW